jgi:hypothetical protein
MKAAKAPGHLWEREPLEQEMKSLKKWGEKGLMIGQKPCRRPKVLHEGCVEKRSTSSAKCQVGRMSG